MKRGTKIGWLLIALSVIMSVWVIASQGAKAVTTIGENNEFVVADDDNTRLVGYTGPGGNITIPDTIKRIEATAFQNNITLTGVNLNAVEILDEGAFGGCRGLVTVNLGKITSIPNRAFQECGALSSVTIPGSVESIGSNAFYGCASMSSITIPASVKVLSTDAFTQCGNLQSINVENGGGYKSSDGCVYNAAGTTLLIVPNGKTSVSIAAGTKTIGTGSFNGCTNISSLTIPNGVTTIQENAFSGSSIAVLTVPASVTTFGTQSNWTPQTINGYPGTAAEQYAMNANVLFESLDTDPGGEPTDDPTGDNPSDEPTGDNPSDNPSQGDVVHPDGSVTHPDGSVTNPDGTTTYPDGSVTNANGTHVKDATPKTADGLDPRYFLCLGIFVGGVGVILYSRFNKLKYMSERRDNR